MITTLLWIRSLWVDEHDFWYDSTQISGMPQDTRSQPCQFAVNVRLESL